MSNEPRPRVPRRLPAEWEGHDTILMAWPHEGTDWAYMLDEARACFADIIRAITRYERVLLLTEDGECPPELADVDRLGIACCPLNDTWARDFGPITVVEGPDERPQMIDFKFNGWGLKFAACHDNMASRHVFGAESLENRLSFVLEGGSIESDGRGTLLTTAECLLSPCRNGSASKDEIERYLAEAFGLERVIWLEHGAISGDDTDSHIDTLARLTDADTIVYVAPPAEESDVDYAELAAMERELQALEGYRTVSLPYAGPVYDPADGHRLPATYANFLITPRAVIVPTYALPTDAEALATLADLFPGRDIVGVDCRALIRQHGSLHCVTMQLYTAKQ